ncbi:sodium:solute symporter [Rhizobium leguminosarum]|uniref:sodium:solute symporter family protein n=1 Tax=Rhizobium leguminosarum TaxID=384 RepID=UPI001C97C410|nr:sodium:solute symporter [Rhizobium leguminosarum]MBY5820471.1 sodium:solute symporter [Rhizobium leguminosarum]
MLIAISLTAIVVVAVLIAGFLEKNRRAVAVDQWALGGRRFGTVLVFVLMAGEIYTTFTFLGASGFAYGRGGVVFYILAYTCLGIMISYWLLPPIWKFASDRRLVTQPDFFEKKYESPLLGFVVSIVGLIALIPYLILQLKGLGIIAETLSEGRVSNHEAVGSGAIIMALYVIVSGMKGSAWAAVVKDATTWVVCAFLGLYLPYHYFGGIGDMFREIEAVRPGFTALPSTGQTIVWYCSTIFLSALGLYMWPHTFSSAYTSKSAMAFRKNAIFMPIYSLVMLFAMLVGFAAVLRIPGLEGQEVDLSLLKLSIATFDPWIVGVIGGAGVLAAMVPGATILITGATIVSNNICWKLIPSLSPYQLTNCARISVLLITGVAVFFTLIGDDSIVAILIMGYSIVTQLFPSLFASLLPSNPFTKEGAIAGIIVGLGTVGIVSSTGLNIATFFPGAPIAIKEINVGFIAMTLNVMVALLVSIATDQ